MHEGNVFLFQDEEWPQNILFIPCVLLVQNLSFQLMGNEKK